MNRTPFATFWPFISAAPSRRSSIRAFVHDPRNAWSIRTCSRATSGSGRTLSGEYGQATIGTISSTLMSIVRSYVRIGVRAERVHRVLRDRREIIEGRLVRGDHAGFGAHLGRHVAEREPLRHGEPFDRRTRVLDRLVGRPGGLHLADDPEDKVLRRHARPERPLDADRDRGRDLQPEPAEGKDRGHLGRADPRGEGAHRAQHVRVGVGPDREIAGDDPAVLGQDLVADPVLPDVVEVRQVRLLGELAQDPVQDCRPLGRRRHPVVDSDDDPVRIPHPLGPHLVERADRLRPLLVHHREVDRPLDDLARDHGTAAGRAGEDLLREGLAVGGGHALTGRIPTASTSVQNSSSVKPGLSKMDRYSRRNLLRSSLLRDPGSTFTR